MSSIAEMMQLAQYQTQNNNPLPGALAGALTGYFSGVEEKKQREKDQKAAEEKQATTKLDNYIKLLDINEKVQKIKGEQQTQEINANFAKAYGLLSMTPTEKRASVNASWDSLGNSKNPQFPKTAAGSIASIMDNFEIDPHWSSTKGWTLSGSNKTKKTGSAAADNTKRLENQEIIKQAQAMAVNEQYEKATAGMDSQKIAALKISKGSFSPDPLLVHKYLSLSTALVQHDTATYEKLFKQLFPKKDLPPSGKGKTTVSPQPPSNATPKQSSIWDAVKGLQKKLSQKNAAPEAWPQNDDES